MPNQLKIVHFRNLTRGILCQHNTPNARMVRIPSTWCEQKHWDRLILSTSPDMLYNLAIGNIVFVHDVSERPRETRAMWQGLEIIRFAAEMNWNDGYRGWTPPSDVYFRMHNVTDYAVHVYRNLSKSAHNWLKHYRQYREGVEGLPVMLHSCYQPWDPSCNAAVKAKSRKTTVKNDNQLG